jgi:DNA-binding GntR family transcriptional regulator
MANENTSDSGSQAAGAYESIRQAIIEWELRPGEHITEHGLVNSTGFGRASVRAALTRLRHEHLVIAMPRRGYQVAPITFKDVTDVFGVRLVIEPVAARQVANRADPAIIEELDAINENCRIQEGPYSAGTYRAANNAFHVALARGTGNDRLAGITRTSLDDLQRILYLPQVARETDRVNATYDEHAAIIYAIRRRDPATAERLMHEHIELNKVQLIDALITTSNIGAINLVDA